eukprot:9467759-Pyramimonas_sp.AAC.1
MADSWARRGEDQHRVMTGHWAKLVLPREGPSQEGGGDGAVDGVRVMGRSHGMVLRSAGKVLSGQLQVEAASSGGGLRGRRAGTVKRLKFHLQEGRVLGWFLPDQKIQAPQGVRWDPRREVPLAGPVDVNHMEV